MKKIQLAVLTLLLFSFSFSPATGWAHAHPARELSGGVQSIDPSHRLIVFIADKNARKMTFAFDRQTQYVKDGQLVAANEVPEGAAVKIWYTSPFFGHRIITRVVWNTR